MREMRIKKRRIFYDYKILIDEVIERFNWLRKEIEVDTEYSRHLGGILNLGDFFILFVLVKSGIII